MIVAEAGTIESSDCLITVYPANKVEIEITSIVYDQFGDTIKKVIIDTLLEKKVVCKVVCKDKGAYDYTIKARLLTALRRSNNE